MKRLIVASMILSGWQALSCADHPSLSSVSVARVKTYKNDLIRQAHVRKKRAVIGGIGAGIGVALWYAYKRYGFAAFGVHHEPHGTSSPVSTSLDQSNVAAHKADSRTTQHFDIPFYERSFPSRMKSAVEYGALLGIAGSVSALGSMVVQHSGEHIAVLVSRIRAYLVGRCSVNEYWELVCDATQAFDTFARHMRQDMVNEHEWAHGIASLCLAHNALVDEVEHFLGAAGARAHQRGDATFEAWVCDEHNNVLSALRQVHDALEYYVKRDEHDKQFKNEQLETALYVLHTAMQRVSEELLVKKLW